MLKLLTIVGALPQFIKAAAISREIRSSYNNTAEEILIHTGQHYDQSLSEVFFREMGIPKPSYNLGVGSGNHGYQTGKMLNGLEEIIVKEKPDGVIVYGDTNSTLAAAISASKLFVPLIHIEAGLRSFNKTMPEEINRIVTDHVSTLMFSPTDTGIHNLEKEGFKIGSSSPYSIDNPGIFQCGDVMYDNTIFFQKRAKETSQIFSDHKIDKSKYVLATIHRPANTDSPKRLENILLALLDLPFSQNTEVVLPLHPRTSNKLKSFHNQALLKKLNPQNGIHLIPAVSFLDMIELENNAKVILTDSGGVQKEAWFLKKPVVILRAETEWTEIVAIGNGVLADASTENIIQSVEKYLQNPPMNFPTIYGDANAAGKILKIVTTTQWG